MRVVVPWSLVVLIKLPFFSEEIGIWDQLKGGRVWEDGGGVVGLYVYICGG